MGVLSTVLVVRLVESKMVCNSWRIAGAIKTVEQE
jgi:hypothetical protein